MNDRIKTIALRILGQRGSSFIRSALDSVRFFCPHDPLVLVYQMGKVGSQSVNYALLEIGFFPVVHFHYLKDLKREKKHHYIWVAYALALEWPIKVITLVRDPVARNVSSFAHDFSSYFGSNMQDHSLQKLGNKFWVWDRHFDGINWFDKEFKNVLGVDIYDCPFDKEAGFSIYRSRDSKIKYNQGLTQKNFEILIMKIELRNEIREDIIKEFLNITEFSQKYYNVASDRSYKGNYQEFVQWVKFPQSYLNEQYNSKFTQHFYTKREIANFERRWLLG